MKRGQRQGLPLQSSIMIAIRPIQASDFVAVQLLAQNFLSLHHYDKTLREEINQNLSQAFVLEDDNQIFGFLSFRTVAEDEGEILQLVVDPGFRRKSLGRALVQYLFQQNPQIQKWYLEVRVGNTNACSFYKNLGFIETGRRKKYYRDGEDALLMMRSISHPS